LYTDLKKQQNKLARPEDQQRTCSPHSCALWPDKKAKLEQKGAKESQIKSEKAPDQVWLCAEHYPAHTLVLKQRNTRAYPKHIQNTKAYMLQAELQVLDHDLDHELTVQDSKINVPESI
jgi:hypothetical protein